MKLTIEKHPDFSRLTHYFRSIEDLAENLGIDVDALHPNHHFHPVNSELSAPRKASVNPARRAEIFRESTGVETSLRAIVNPFNNGK
ncbi:MAG: hypothetical protein U0X76_11450 [Bacteroidia bacterium]